MKTIHLTPVAKARIWFGMATPGFSSSASVYSCVECDAHARLASSRVTLEALVPRGAYAQYGLLGLMFGERPTKTLEVEVHYSGSNEVPWLESLARQVDDVRLGLPLEYANSVLTTAASFALHRLPPGRLEAVESAHGIVGSSADIFRRLTLGILSLMQSPPAADEDLRALLKGILVD